MLKKLLSYATGWTYFRPVLYTAIAVTVLVVVLMYSCGGGDKDSKLEEGIRQDQGVTIEKDAERETIHRDVEAKRVTVDKKRELSDQAERRSQRVREERKEGVTYEEANRARCEAYPESSECTK